MVRTDPALIKEENNWHNYMIWLNKYWFCYFGLKNLVFFCKLYCQVVAYTNKLIVVSGNKIKSLPQSNQPNTTERIWWYQKVRWYCPKYWLTELCFWFFTLLVLLTFLWLHIKLLVHRHFILLKDYCFIICYAFWHNSIRLKMSQQNRLWPNFK